MTDHTDPGHVTGAHERPGRGAGTRVGDSGSPVGSPLTIVLAVIAVAVGLLIFRSISDDGDASGGGLPDGNTTLPTGVTVPGQTTVAGGGTAAPTTPTTAAPTKTGATVVVANASSTGQVAGSMSDLLAEAGYTMGEATSQIDNADNPNLEESIVYFDVGNNCEAVARSVANDMGGIDVEAMPSPVPTEGNVIDGCVLLMLGNDFAGDEELPGPPAAAPAAPTNPTTTTA